MSYSVLLADDEPLTLSYLKGIIPRLEPEFSEILCAQNGREALELLKKRPADLVITDIRMPETDGLTLIRELREQKLCTKIVILSGYDEFSYAQQAIRCGVQDYLLKPIEKQKIADLLRTVKAELDRVRLAAEEQRTMQNSVSAYQLNAAAEQLNALASLHADAAALRKTTLPDLPLFARQNVVLAFGYDAMSLAHKCASVQDLDLYDYVLYQLLRDMAREHTPEQVWFFGRERYMLLCGSEENAPAAARRIGQQLTDLLQRTAALHLYVAYSPVFSAAEDFPLCAARAEQNLCRGWSISLAEKWENRVNDLALQNVLLDCAEAQNGSRLKTLLNSYLSGIENTPAVQAFAALHLLYPRSELLLRHTVSQAAYAAAVAELLQALPTLGEASANEMLYHCLLSLFRKTACAEAQNSELTERAKAYIGLHFAEAISLMDIADYLNVTPNYLSAMFHSAAGESYVKYLTRIRMQHAAALLQDSSLKIADVAQQCGYYSIKNFFRVFKSTYGQTPNEFRSAPEHRR